MKFPQRRGDLREIVFHKVGDFSAQQHFWNDAVNMVSDLNANKTYLCGSDTVIDTPQNLTRPRKALAAARN